MRHKQKITHKKLPGKPDNNRRTKSNCNSPNNTGANPKHSQNYNENEIKTSNKKRIRRSKKKQKNTPVKENNVTCSNTNGIKSKVNSLKQFLINNPCEIIALCRTHLKK